MKRSRFENQELQYNIRLNGRIVAAFRVLSLAENLLFLLAQEKPGADIQLSDQNGNVLMRSSEIKKAV